MCEFCSNTNYLISEEYITEEGIKVFADLRFDTDYNQLEIKYGVLDNSGGEWSKSLNIKYCPICGKKLQEAE